VSKQSYVGKIKNKNGFRKKLTKRSSRHYNYRLILSKVVVVAKAIKHYSNCGDDHVVVAAAEVRS